jgi:hypothetical protein
MQRKNHDFFQLFNQNDPQNCAQRSRPHKHSIKSYSARRHGVVSTEHKQEGDLGKYRRKMQLPSATRKRSLPHRMGTPIGANPSDIADASRILREHHAQERGRGKGCQETSLDSVCITKRMNDKDELGPRRHDQLTRCQKSGHHHARPTTDALSNGQQGWGFASLLSKAVDETQQRPCLSW